MEHGPALPRHEYDVPVATPRRAHRPGATTKRRLPWQSLLIAVLVLIVASIAATFLTAEPLRRRVEANANAQLAGYHLSIGGMRLHPIGFGVVLTDVVITQNAHPKPPVARFPVLTSTVHWRALLLHGRLVADVLLERPQLDIDLTQTRAEATDKVRLKDRGWQAAAEEIYPLKINQLRIRDGSVRYRDTGDLAPLELSSLQLTATNIRNVASPDRVYPSGLTLTTIVFNKGRLRVDGHANFLAEPFVGVDVKVDLDQMPLGYLEPVAKHWNMVVHGGVLSAHGTVEYAPHMRQVKLADAAVDDTEIEFAFAEARTGTSREVVNKVGQSVRDASDNPQMWFEVNTLRVRRSRLGIANRDADPNYDVFIRADPLEVKHLTNLPNRPAAAIDLQGQFMDSGPATLHATFRPNTPPDLDIRLEIHDTDMRTLNDVWRAHGGFDVAAGRLSLFSEITVRNDAVDGYVKPIFEDISVYDPEQDRDKSLPRKAYEAVVGGVATVLTDQSRDTVATRTSLAGRLENPQSSTLEILLSLLQNAFVKAILPGLERHRPAHPAK